MTEATPEDLQEQALSPSGDAPRAETPEIGAEVPEADALEQAQPAAPGEHRAARDLPSEADDLDAAEQAVVVAHDEDDAPRDDEG